MQAAHADALGRRRVWLTACHPAQKQLLEDIQQVTVASAKQVRWLKVSFARQSSFCMQLSTRQTPSSLAATRYTPVHPAAEFQRKLSRSAQTPTLSHVSPAEACDTRQRTALLPLSPMVDATGKKTASYSMPSVVSIAPVVLAVLLHFPGEGYPGAVDCLHLSRSCPMPALSIVG